MRHMAINRLTTRVEDLQSHLLVKTGSGPTASVFLRNEFYNFFCVEGKGSCQVKYTGDELDIAISGLVDDGRFADYGSDLFGPPRPKFSTETSYGAEGY